MISQPVVVSGHSSGGQLAAWLAGHRPDLISAVVLEDPPLFTTLLPRAKQTWNWVDLATTCHDFLESKRQTGLPTVLPINGSGPSSARAESESSARD